MYREKIPFVREDWLSDKSVLMGVARDAGLSEGQLHLVEAILDRSLAQLEARVDDGLVEAAPHILTVQYGRYAPAGRPDLDMEPAAIAKHVIQIENKMEGSGRRRGGCGLWYRHRRARELVPEWPIMRAQEKAHKAMQAHRSMWVSTSKEIDDE